MVRSKLLIISYDFPPSTGGIARLCSEIAKGMHSYYKHIEVVTVGMNNSLDFDSSQDYQIIRFKGTRGFLELRFCKYLKSIKNKEQIDVLCGLWYPDGLLAVLAGFKNLFILAHGAEFLSGNSLIRKYIWQRMFGKWILGKAKVVIANSHFTGNLVMKINSNSKIKVLPLGVDHHFFSPDANRQKSSPLLISTVSRILQFKGHDFVLKSLEKLPSDVINKLEWHIAGTGPYKEKFESIVSKSKLKEKVHFHGFVSEKELPDFYRNSDVFILTTQASDSSNQVEGFGLVFLEAQACGVPVVGTATGGIPDAIEHGNGGWLIEQNNVNALVDLLTSFVNSPSILADQGAKARSRVICEATFNTYNQKLAEIIKTF